MITPHVIPQAGSMGHNPHAVQQTLTPQMSQQQFLHQWPQHSTVQPVTMPRDGSFAAPPTTSQAAPEVPAPTQGIADPSLSMAPYSLCTSFNQIHRRIGEFTQEITMITKLTDSKQDLAGSSSLRTLGQLTPYKLEAFKFEFKTTTGKSLHDFCMSLVAKQDDKVKTLVAGLTLGPVEFDLYLLKSATLKNADDDLIHLFIGRDQTDVRYLNQLWKNQTGSTLTASIASFTSSKNLKYALQICTANHRDEPTKPVNEALVHRDVSRLQDLLQMTFTSTARGGYSVSTGVLDLILHRDSPTIQRMALYFETATGYKLDEKIRKSTLDDMTKKIAVHAVRTATDPTYRDLMSIKDVISKPGKEMDLAIRMCRAHWYDAHWRQIQAAAVGILGWEIREKVGKMPKGLFKDLLMAMMTPSS